MKITSIKRLVLSLIVALGSFMTLPAYAWPDTDEMNMCGAAVKKIRAYNGDHRGWESRDNYIDFLGAQYYYLANCPQSKATKNYKGKDWTPGAKMPAKTKAKKKMYNKKARQLNVSAPKSKKTKDCIRTDALNSSGPIVKKVTKRRPHVAAKPVQKVDHNFYRQAQAVLNMSKVKRKNVVYNPKSKKTKDCIRTDGLNSAGAIVRVVRKSQH